MNIVNEIGLPATLEQCAEECNELAQACLKMARKLRGDNPTPKSIDEIVANLTEEIADVEVCIDEILYSKIVSDDSIDTVKKSKTRRWRQRVLNKQSERGDTNANSQIYCR